MRYRRYLLNTVYTTYLLTVIVRVLNADCITCIASSCPLTSTSLTAMTTSPTRSRPSDAAFPSSSIWWYKIRMIVEFFLAFLPPANVVCKGYVFTSVCLSTGGGLPHCMLGHWPPDQRQDTPSRGPEVGTHPQPPWLGASTPWGRPPTPGTRGRHPLTGADPPGAVHAGRYGQQVGSMHPTGMQFCLA